jgi:hypothetical protein
MNEKINQSLNDEEKNQNEKIFQIKQMLESE